MRLFGKVDGAVDRFDRAQWLTQPFDLAFQTPAPPPVSTNRGAIGTTIDTNRTSFNTSDTARYGTTSVSNSQSMTTSDTRKRSATSSDTNRSIMTTTDDDS